MSRTCILVVLLVAAAKILGSKSSHSNSTSLTALLAKLPSQSASSVLCRLLAPALRSGFFPTSIT